MAVATTPTGHAEPGGNDRGGGGLNGADGPEGVAHQVEGAARHGADGGDRKVHQAEGAGAGADPAETDVQTGQDADVGVKGGADQTGGDAQGVAGEVEGGGEHERGKAGRGGDQRAGDGADGAEAEADGQVGEKAGDVVDVDGVDRDVGGAGVRGVDADGQGGRHRADGEGGAGDNGETAVAALGHGGLLVCTVKGG